MKGIIFYLWMVLCSGWSVAQSLEGNWQGTLSAQSTEIGMNFHFYQEDGSWKGYLDIPQQGLKKFALQEVSFEDDSLYINMPQLGAQYSGALQEDRKTIKGEFTQYGAHFPLHLSRGKTSISRPQEPTPPYPYETKEVVFENKMGDFKLSGTLSFPKEKGHFPAVILIHGSGPNGRDETLLEHKPFLVLADYLTRHGIAVLRYDKRGIGKSEGHYKGATSLDFAEDTEAALNFLKQQPTIDSTKIGLIGHSEGGIIAPMVATNHPEIEFIILMAGTGVSGADILLKQQHLIGTQLGQSEAYLKSTLEVNKKAYQLINDYYEQDELATRLRDLFEHAIKEHPILLTEPDLTQEEYLTKTIDTYTDSWMQFFLTYDPAPALSKVKSLVLAINGTKDLQVDADQNLPIIKKALTKGGNTAIQINYISGVNHLFQESKTGALQEYGEIEQTLAPKVLELIKDWILKTQ